MTVYALSWRHTSTHNEGPAVSMQRAVVDGVMTLHPTNVSLVHLQCNRQIVQPIWKLSGQFFKFIHSIQFYFGLT